VSFPITINGDPVDAASGTTLADLVAARCPSPAGVAVAVNGEVVHRGAWDATGVRAGDAVEIVTAAAGG
jgi:sulfur carrier protein